MNTLFVGKNFVELPAVDSTNTFALALLESRPADGTVIYTRHQFAGRGQQGSAWLGAPGENIAVSIILYPTFIQATRAFVLSKAIAVAVRDTVQHFLPDSLVEVKWPNDVLVDRRKVAGILLENQLQGSLLASAVVGIGLNVNQAQFDDAAYGRPTSLRQHAGRGFVLQEVLDMLLSQFERRYLAIRAGRLDGLEHDYLHALYGYQEEVPVHIDGSDTHVMPMGVDAQGRLIVQQAGKLRHFNLKEIAFLL